MWHNRFLTIFLTCSIIFLAAFTPAAADSCIGPTSCPQTLLDLAPIAVLIIGSLLSLSIVIFFFMILLNGYLFLTAGGDAKKVASARKSLFYSTLGFALIFLVFVIFGLLINVLGVNTGVVIDKNGNIHIDYASHFSATPLPQKLVSTYVPQAGDSGPSGTEGGSINGDPTAGGITSTNGYGEVSRAKLEDGCYVEFVGDVPIAYQWYDTNPGPDTPGWYGGSSGGPGIDCQKFGEYNGSEALTYSMMHFSCSAGALSTIINTYVHKAGGKDNFYTIYDIAQNESGKGVLITDGYTGSNYISKTASSHMGRFSAMLDIANEKGRGIHFKGSSFSIKNDTNLQAILKAANGGNPVIVGMETIHFVIVLSSNATTVTFADTGPLIGLKRLGASGKFDTKTGIQTESLADFSNAWDGVGVLIEPDKANGQL